MANFGIVDADYGDLLGDGKAKIVRNSEHGQANVVVVAAHCNGFVGFAKQRLESLTRAFAAQRD